MVRQMTFRAPGVLILPLLVAAAGCGSQETSSESPAGTESIEADADARLRAMSEHLAGLDTFAVKAAQTFDSDDGEPRSTELELLVERPGRLRASSSGTEGRQLTVFDGSSLRIVFFDDEAWTEVDVEGTNDDLADTLAERYGMFLPLADLLAASPYDSLVDAGMTGRLMGAEEIAGRACDLLSFDHEAVSWEVCVASDGDPVPLRMTVDSHSFERRSTSTFSDWSSSPATDGAFELEVPEDFEQLELLPLDETESQSSEETR